MKRILGKYTEAQVMIDDIDEATEKQIQSMVNNDAFENPVVIMVDCHAGKGSVIGFTMKMGRKIIPNVSGVDLNCGVLSIKTDCELIPDLAKLNSDIRCSVPMGHTIFNTTGWGRCISGDWRESFPQEEALESICKRVGIKFLYALNSLGTLGGGNHFIEIGQDTRGFIWITVHSGSRKLGLNIANYWQKLAISKWYRKYDVLADTIVATCKAQKREKEIEGILKSLPICNEEMIALEDEEDIEGYLADVAFTQIYAHTNRRWIIDRVLDLLGAAELDSIESVHNYIDMEDGFIRKGAIRSYIGERMVIPFNMRDGLLICEGKSNPDWNFSAPHGAGRILSRNEAKKRLDLDEFKSQMASVYSTSVCAGTLDEAPAAYKDSVLIERLIEPTVKVIERVKPILNLKAV